MSIYATGWSLRLPVDVRCAPEEQDATAYGPGADISGPGTPTRERWVEVYFQHVPNHINEENGYGWDYLPPFVHQDGCVRNLHAVTFQEPPWIDCECGDRCVFVLDDDHEEKIGQQYTEPLLVLSGAEYETAGFEYLMRRLSEALEERFGVHNSGGVKVVTQ